MRCVLALLIVFMHSFTCYDGNWRTPEGYIDIPLYKWLSRISFAFTLEAFVFISGYLYAFQRITLKRVGGVIISKLKRLLLPCVIFSTAYYIIFLSYKSCGNLIYSILSGCGHMWFLPMLFWCYLGGWLLVQLKIKDSLKIIFLIILNLMIIVPLPLRISNAATYMIYFYAGYLLYCHKEYIRSHITLDNLAIGWIFFIIVFSFFRPLVDVMIYADDSSQTFKLGILIVRNGFHLIYATMGVIVFYCTAIYFVQRNQINAFIIKLSTYCFGIYLFQQFVLQLLYYNTDVPSLIGPYWLPWCGFIIATLISYVLTNLLMKTRIGKYLIG